MLNHAYSFYSYWFLLYVNSRAFVLIFVTVSISRLFGTMLARSIYICTEWIKKNKDVIRFSTRSPLRQILTCCLFSNFFHWHSRQEICNNAIIKDPTIPHLCRYITLWNISFHKMHNEKHRNGRPSAHAQGECDRDMTIAQYTPPTPTRLNCRVESRRRCEHTRRQSRLSLQFSVLWSYWGWWHATT